MNYLNRIQEEPSNMTQAMTLGGCTSPAADLILWPGGVAEVEVAVAVTLQVQGVVAAGGRHEEAPQPAAVGLVLHARGVGQGVPPLRPVAVLARVVRQNVGQVPGPSGVPHLPHPTAAPLEQRRR